MEHFWPITTGKTFFDVWFIVHLCFWVFMGSNFWAAKVPKWRAVCWGLALSFAWEFFERFAEPTWPDVWLNPESWINSYLSDPLTAVIGILGIHYLLDKRAQ